jgi:hypothetical protein
MVTAASQREKLQPRSIDAHALLWVVVIARPKSAAAGKNCVIDASTPAGAGLDLYLRMRVTQTIQQCVNTLRLRETAMGKWKQFAIVIPLESGDRMTAQQGIETIE